MRRCLKKNLKFGVWAFLLFGIILLSLNSVSALNTTFYAEKDSYVREDSATSNYGTSTSLDLRSHLTNARRIYLYFPITLATNNSITSASVCLYQYVSGTTLNGSIYYLYSDWINGLGTGIMNETQITWNNQPCGTGFTNSTYCNLTSINLQSTQVSGYVCWNVTTPVRRKYAQNISFAIKSLETTDLTTDSFYSRENITYKPYLFVEYNDITSPNIQFVSPTETSGTFLNRNSILVNVTATDDVLLKNITIDLYNSTGLVNTSTSLTSPFYLNFTNLPNGIYYFNSTAIDESNNHNSTTTRNVTLDVTSPNIQFVSPTETSGTFLNRNSILVNVTATDDVLLKNITINLYNSTGLVNTSTSLTSPFYLNFTNLPNGIYYFNSTAIDRSGNQNYTETRNVTLDITYPSISFVYPTANQNAVLSQNWTYINVSAFDINEKEITFRLYNVSYDLINQTIYSTSVRDINFTNLPNGFYFYNVTIEDMAGNKNTTETRTIVLDYISPTINSVSPENNYGSSNSTINFSANASNMNLTNATLSIYNSSGGLVTNVSLNITGSSSVFSSVVNLFDGVFTWFWQVWDWAGNSVNSLAYYLTIDTSIPHIVINYPLDNANYSVNLDTLIYNPTGVGNLTECWYSLDNGITNISMSCLDNNISVLTNNGNNRWLVAMNNSFGNYSEDRINFNVNCVNPNAILSLTSYPYVSVNETNNFSLSSFLVGISNIKINITTPNMSEFIFNLTYNSITHAYEQTLFFTELGNYPFVVSGDGICPTLSPSITGTFLVRQPYDITFCGFNQDDYSPYENDYAYLIAEPTTSKKYYDNNLEQFVTPLGFATTYDTPVFHTYYRNGCGTLKLYEPNQEYAVRLFDGIATYETTLSAPNISKTYGTNVFFGKYSLNGTDTSYRVLLSDKDIHQYRWLFNWIYVILLGVAVIGSIFLFFVIPQNPMLSLIFGLGFTTMLTLLRIVIWIWRGW